MKVIYLFGIFCINFLLACAFIFLGNYVGSTYVESFIQNDLISVSATILGFSLTGVIFLLGTFQNFKVNFNNTKVEIKHNIYASTILFVFNLLLVILSETSKHNSNGFMAIAIFTVFFLQISLVLEIISATFKMQKTND